LRFDLLFGVGDGVGETFFDFGEAVGVGLGVVFFFRCLRDELGVGSGSKVFLIFVPNDSCAGYAVGRAPNAIATAKNHLITVLNAISFVGRFCETPIVVSPVLSGESSPVVRPDAMRHSGTVQHIRSTGRMPAGHTDKMSVLRLRELLQDCFV